MESIPAAGATEPRRAWSRDANVLDFLVVVLTIALALVTVWFASAPVLSTGRFFLLTLLWPVAGVAWALSVITSVRRTASVGTAIALLIVSVALVGGPGFVIVPLLFVGPFTYVIGLAAGLAALALIVRIERRPRAVWLVAPVIVLITLGLYLSGTPRAVRFAFAEPVLTAFAEDVLADPDAPRERGRRMIGGIGVGRPRVRDGCVVMGTAQVGILGDVSAGIAYCPAGPTGNPTQYEPFSGRWYRW